MHKDHAWRVNRSSDQVVGRNAANVNVLLLNFISRGCVRFFGGALHILASDHASWSRTGQGRQVNAEFLRQPPCRRRGIDPPTRADGSADRELVSGSRCIARRWLLVQCLSLLSPDLSILANQRRYLFIGQIFVRRDNDGKSSSDRRVLSLRHFQPAQDPRCRHFHFVRGFLALDFHERLALPDSVSRMFQPLDDKPGLHRESPFGHTYNSCQAASPLSCFLARAPASHPRGPPGEPIPESPGWRQQYAQDWERRTAPGVGGKVPAD